ncbi:hypothetical protein [Myroides fluvii]|uniref:hypothetical protein n=1 Tax=Myroides fluvii TaxID=2572594 RepID=UPI001E5A74F0|nr:hypothetical protein [Myroides fluvii]
MKEEFKKKRAIDEEAMMALMVDGLRPNGFTEAELNAPGIRDEEEDTVDEPKEKKTCKKRTELY